MVTLYCEKTRSVARVHACMAEVSYWHKKKVNYYFLSSLVKEFEHIVGLHKRLYVDFAFNMMNEVSLDSVPKKIKQLYTEYKNIYNEFIFAYGEFAIQADKAQLRIFNKQKMPKANDLI